MKVRPWLLMVLLVAIAAGGFFLFLLRRVEVVDLRQLQDDLTSTASSVAASVAEPLSRGKLAAVEVEQVRKMAVGTRIRVLTADLQVVADSYGATGGQDYLRARPEVESALRGDPAAYTRFSDETERSLALFVATPVRFEGRVVGVAYVSRSTDSILYKLAMLRVYFRDWLIFMTVAVFLGAVYLSGDLRATLSRVRVLTSGSARVALAGDDEVARIGENFNRLVGSLERKIAELEEERDKTRRFVEDIAHELKTPITGLTGSVEVLGGQDWSDDADVRRLLGNVKKETDRLAQLTGRLLDLQKLDYYQLKPERFELLSLLETVVDSLDLSRKCVALQGPEEVLVLADPAKIRQVVENLLDNAIRCSPQVDLSVVVEGGLVTVVVADRGPGVDGVEIFKRNHQGPAESPVGSLGLGLSIAWEIVRKHGQEIGVRPREGGGSEFFFRLGLSPN